MHDYQHLLVRRHNDVLLTTLNCPETRNALAPEVVAELARVLDVAEAEPAVRALVLRGAQGFFCAGGNVGNFQARLGAESGVEDPVATRNREFGRFMERLVALPVPVIAVVEGAAMGGGMGLACAADLVLATADARFALSETSLGIIPAQIAPFVVARLGHRVALRLGLTGERVSGDTALRLGLVDELALEGAALDALLAQWLTRICNCSPQANRLLKPLLRRCGNEAVSPLLDDAARLFASSMRGEGVEGVAAFREKRPASWHAHFDAAMVRATPPTA